MQSSAADPDLRRIFRAGQARYRNRAKLPLGLITEYDAVIAECSLHTGIDHSDVTQRPQCRSGETNAGPKDAPIRLDLDQVDRDVAAA